MGRKRRELASLVKGICTVQYHLASQREAYLTGRMERDGPSAELAERAAYQKGRKDAFYSVVRSMGEFVGPAPMLPYKARHAGFWKDHDPDDWRQWPDVPEELRGCEWKRLGGVWRPVAKDGRDAETAPPPEP